MNAHLRPPPDSWLSLAGSAETVLGPARGHVPDIGAYRIACVHLSPHSLWLFGAVTDLPPEAESNGSRGQIVKFNLALDIAVHKLVRISGRPELDPEHDDSMHSFELAKPVAVSVRQTEQLVWPDAKHRVLHLVATSPHFRFEVFAQFLHAFGGKHAKTRYVQALHVRS
jgi:hypothetical protein